MESREKQTDIQYRLNLAEQEMYRIQAKVSDLKLQLQQEKQIQATIDYYNKVKTLEHWKLNKNKIKVWFNCTEWQKLAGEEKNIDLTCWMIALIHKESNGNAKIVFREKDGTLSYGITQINITCLRKIEKYLDKNYPEFIGRDIRTDIEKNIAGRYYWIKLRKQYGKNWKYLGNAQPLYNTLQKVKLNG
jgi:hypothetical protein